MLDAGADGWASTMRSVIVDPASGAMITSFERTTFTHNNLTNIAKSQSVRDGAEVAYHNYGDESIRTSDGTYVPTDQTRRTDSDWTELSFITSELDLVRQPTCEEMYGVGTCGNWPACYESVPGTNCDGTTTSASSSTSGRGGGNGWAVGMYEYEACRLEGGTWINTHPDPVGNPNVGYCVWSIIPMGVQSIFVDGANGDHVGHIENVIASGENVYTEDEHGFTMEFNFADAGLDLVITLDAEKRLLAFESFKEGSDSSPSELFGLFYSTTKDTKDDNGDDIIVFEKANTGGWNLYLTPEERGFYWYECPPMVMMPLGTSSPSQWCDDKFGTGGGIVGGGGIGVGQATTFTQIRDVVDTTIGNADSTPTPLALKFVCDDGAELWLAQTQDGVDDCTAGEDETFDSESGLTFVVADEQIKRPLTTSFEIHFIADNATNYDNETVLQTSPLHTTSSDDSTDDATAARTADDGRDQATVSYTDADEDGRISPGDTITLIFSNDEIALFVDKNVEHFSGLQIDKEFTGASGGITTKDMTCEEQSDSLCTASWTYYNDVTGVYVTNTWCELRPEGYDCNGNPTATETS
jgi:hypothetical protein